MKIQNNVFYYTYSGDFYPELAAIDISGRAAGLFKFTIEGKRHPGKTVYNFNMFCRMMKIIMLL